MIPKIIGRQLFDVIRNEDVIKEYLNAAYVNSKAFDGSFVDSFDGWGGGGGGGSCKDDDDDNNNNDGGRGETSLGLKIRACTENNGGHAAFASILWSAPASGVSFYDALEQLQEVDVLLLFGADDPWCTQAVGKRMHVTLDKLRSDEEARTTVSTAAHRFVTLDNVGHCPNHEAPTAVARVLLPWLNANDSDQRRVVPLGSQTLIKEPWGEVFIREVSIAESNSLGLVDRVVSTMVG
jgi:pimeloyl-ACP methyl ester carboxylesterase